MIKELGCVILDFVFVNVPVRMLYIRQITISNQIVMIAFL